MVKDRKTANGYPVNVFLREAGRPPKKRVLLHTEIEHYNTVTGMLMPTHPNYNVLIAGFLEVKNKVVLVNCGNYSYDQALKLLFEPDKKISAVFYEAGLLECGKMTDGSASIYKTALNSFKTMYPGIMVLDITPNKVKRYMDALLLVNKPNGVHTYLRKLSTLYKRVSDSKNPFTGIRPKKVKTPKKSLLDADLLKLFTTRTIIIKGDYKNTRETINHYRYYYMLMFYLGGIDIVDLAHLRYDKHVFGGRLQFYRQKGGTNAYVNNKLFPQALGLLKKFDCYPYLVPIYKYKTHHEFVNNMNSRLFERTKDLELSRKPLTKSARYSFINRAQQLLIDQRITMEIVGHEQQTVHSIYTDNFPLKVRDEAHERIIDLPVISFS